MLPGHGSKFSKEGECGVKDEAPISGLWVNGRTNTWLAASHSLRRALPDNPPYSCLSATPAPRPHSPHSSDAKSPFQVSWACLVGLLHYMLNHLNGRGGESSQFIQQPTSKTILSEGLTEPPAILKTFTGAGFINAKWNAVFLPDALIYGAVLVRACVGDFF